MAESHPARPEPVCSCAWLSGEPAAVSLGSSTAHPLVVERPPVLWPIHLEVVPKHQGMPAARQELVTSQLTYMQGKGSTRAT